MITYAFLGIAAFVMSLLGTRITILAYRANYIPRDYEELQSGLIPVARNGGFVLIFSLVICLLVADISAQPFVFVLPIMLLASVALMREAIEIPEWVVFLVQVFAVVIPLGLRSNPLIMEGVPMLIEQLIIGLLWLIWIRLFSKYDEIPGLCASQMVSLGAALCMVVAFQGGITHSSFVFGLIIAAAGVGFLWWNWPPAKILLGAVGAQPSAFLTGYMLLLAAEAGYVHAVLILCAYVFSDGVISTLAKREYYFEKALAHGRTPKGITRYIIGLHMILAALASIALLDPENALICVGTAYMATFMLLGYFAHNPPGANDYVV